MKHMFHAHSLLGRRPRRLVFQHLDEAAKPCNAGDGDERNRSFDTFGWGVVLSDQALGNLQVADPVSAQLIGDSFNH